MTAVNHAVTGAIIATIAAEPLLIIPLAFGSHFILDALPHLGISTTSRKFKKVLALDVSLVALLFIMLAALRPADWPLMIMGASFAMLPDAVWLPYWIADLRGSPIKLDPFSQFHSRIQWGERPWGYLIEVPWFVVSIALLYALNIQK